MSKILLALVFILILASPSFAIKENPNETGVLEVCTANVTDTSFCTTTGIDLGFYASKGTCTMTASGTAATSFTMSLYGSIDGVTYALMSLPTATTVTYTVATPDTTNTFSFGGQPVRWIKGYRVGKVGGAADSGINMRCVAGGN